ncbi:kinetochore protein NDC80 homolog [Gouania willdenowi]|uniref:kinetochore protein NDC80 homolog n=1 Tax=Gouania willdenowi TaxID=441366 RepID=UPI001054C253|nr:kinetochore protein NDC80 homolog [Gouania willdenowi]
MQHLLQNQKFTFADVERINREKRELQQTISSLTKSHENAEHKWNKEIAKVKEKIKLRKLISDVKEEISRWSNMKLSLEESCEQENSNITDESNDLKQLREQIRKLDERLDSKMQELTREEQDLAEEKESADNHLKLLEKKLNFIYHEAVQQLKAAQQQYHLVLQETNEKRRTVANNLASVFTTAANDLSITEKCLEDLHSRIQRICSKAVEEDKASLQKMQETVKNFMSKANNM